MNQTSSFYQKCVCLLVVLRPCETKHYWWPPFTVMEIGKGSSNLVFGIYLAISMGIHRTGFKCSCPMDISESSTYLCLQTFPKISQGSISVFLPSSSSGKSGWVEICRHTDAHNLYFLSSSHLALAVLVFIDYISSWCSVQTKTVAMMMGRLCILRGIAMCVVNDVQSALASHGFEVFLDPFLFSPSLFASILYPIWRI